MSSALQLSRSFSGEPLTPTQSMMMDTSDDQQKGFKVFWEVRGLRQLVVDYLDVRTGESAARFFCAEDSFQIFTNSVNGRTYAEKDCLEYIRERFYAEQQPTLVPLIKTHLPSLHVLNFLTFPVPAKIVLQLSRDPSTALILAKSSAYLQKIDGENVKKILADKIFATLDHAGVAEKEEISDFKQALMNGQKKIHRKRKQEESLLNPVDKKSRS